MGMEVRLFQLAAFFFFFSRLLPLKDIFFRGEVPGTSLFLSFEGEEGGEGWGSEI